MRALAKPSLELRETRQRHKGNRLIQGLRLSHPHVGESLRSQSELPQSNGEMTPVSSPTEAADRKRL